MVLLEEYIKIQSGRYPGLSIMIIITFFNKQV